MNRRPLRIVLRALLVLGLSVSFVAAPAFAKKRESARGKSRIKVDDYASGSSGSGSVDLGVAEIEGRIFKPAVFFVLARQDFRYSALKFRQSFIDRIVKSAMRRPF